MFDDDKLFLHYTLHDPFGYDHTKYTKIAERHTMLRKIII